MRELTVALISGLAALILKAYNEQLSLAFSWENLKNLLFPVTVAGTVFFTFDVIRSARGLAREVRSESEQEIDLYPSLYLTERFTVTRVPSFYRLKITGMAASLILMFSLACFATWNFGNQSKSPIPVQVTSSPVMVPVPDLSPSPSAPTSAPYFGLFLRRLTALHNGYKTYQILSPAGAGTCSFYVRLGRMPQARQVHVAVYIPQLYCTNAILDSIAKNYTNILQELKDAVKRDSATLDFSVEPLIFIYSDDTTRSAELTAISASKHTSLSFVIETPKAGYPQ